ETTNLSVSSRQTIPEVSFTAGRRSGGAFSATRSQLGVRKRQARVGGGKQSLLRGQRRCAHPVRSEGTRAVPKTGGAGRHLVHIHFEQHRTLSRNGVATKPNTQVNARIDYARKDAIELNTNEEIGKSMRFRDMI